MRGWLSCNRRRHRSWPENGEQREPEKEECGEAKAAVREGCPPQPQPQAESQPDAAAESGGPEGLATAFAPPLPAAPLASKDAPPAASLYPTLALTQPVPCQEITTLIQELEAVREFQSCHHRERKKDLRSCQDCLKSLKALREHLQTVRSRLWRVEAKLGIQVPPQELDPEDEKEAPEEEGSHSSRALAPPPERDGPEDRAGERNRAESVS